jgi:hypothetical protein
VHGERPDRHLRTDSLAAAGIFLPHRSHVRRLGSPRCAVLNESATSPHGYHGSTDG